MNDSNGILGNLTVSDVIKKSDKLWQIRLKNNLTMDGKIIDFQFITSFNLQINEEIYLSNNFFEIEQDYILVDINLENASLSAKKEGIYPVIGNIIVDGTVQQVEILAWNGTVIKDAYEETEYNISGIGRNDNNLFIFWNRFKKNEITNVDYSDYQLVLTFRETITESVVLTSKNGLFSINGQKHNSDMFKVSFDLDTINFHKSQKLNIQVGEFNEPVTFSNVIQQSIVEIQNRALTFSYDVLGNSQIDIDYRPILVTGLSHKNNSVIININVPQSFVIEKSQLVPDNYINVVMGKLDQKISIGLLRKVLETGTSVQYQVVLPVDNVAYGMHELQLVVFNENYQPLRFGLLRLGNFRKMFYELELGADIKIIEDSKRKNHPLLVQRHTINIMEEDQIQIWQSKSRDSAPKRWAQDYTLYREQLPIYSNAIFYESFFGAGLTDNPYALFRYILKIDSDKKYRHIIVVNDEKTIHVRRFKKYENVFFIKYNSPEYKRWLAIAEYLVFNTSTAHYFSARRGQKVLQTWHGVPLKALGRDMKQTRGANRNVIRSFAQATIISNPNIYTEEKVVDTLDFKDLQLARRVITSYPRQERIINAKNENFREEILARVIKLDPTKKIVLYAPTWRGENGNYKDVANDYLRQIQLFKKYLPNNYQILLKPHLNATKFIKNADVEIVPPYLEVNEILSVTDVLISDYSSIIFDFYFTGRPTINWMYDKDEYAKNAGFYPEIFSELVWATNDVNKLSWMLKNLNEYPTQHKSFINYNNDDLEKLSDVFLDKKNTELDSQMSTDLYIVYAKDLQREPQKLINRINNLQTYCNNISLLHVGKYDKKDNWIFDKISDNVKNFYRVGDPDITMAEYVSVQKMIHDFKIYPSDEKRIKRFAQRELTREMGNVNIHSVQIITNIEKFDFVSSAIINSFRSR